RVSSMLQADDQKVLAKYAKSLQKQQVPQRKTIQKQVEMFAHLYQYAPDTLTHNISFSTSVIHPAIIKLGLQYAEGIICGSNARCVALLAALKKVIHDYQVPSQKVLSRDLEQKLKPCITFLQQCRPLSVSMGSAIKHIKLQISEISPDVSEKEAKDRLCNSIDRFYNERIKYADESISKTYASTKINDNEVILVYSFSSLVLKILTDAHEKKKKFRVIVVDSRPKLEGRELVNRLVKIGIRCSYVLINAVSYVMKEVTMILLGAHALLANGYVMSRVGTALVASVAHSYNVPVLVCCETYKFHERVQTDAFVFNELGDPDVMIDLGNRKEGRVLDEWRSIDSLRILNLLYDVTPPDFITMVITEVGMVPCTSVPVLLRVKHYN
ncbi:uncharacterized protein TRIADDRAFT_31911, partial [Trichoplax adhaerens]